MGDQPPLHETMANCHRDSCAVSISKLHVPKGLGNWQFRVPACTVSGSI